MPESPPPIVALDELLGLFCSNPAELGKFEPRSIDQCPRDYQTILAHQSHMTVTVEKRHGCPVDVQVLETDFTETHYLREIVLRRQNDRRVVQYGIVRLALAALQPQVRDEIMAQRIPLGRVLINHDVLREVQLHGLWHVDYGPRLAATFELDVPQESYGRTALIYCDGEPAVELLEIVAPEESF
ncbi:MAG TPA: hypothetical protein DDW52_14705 [Planctomycetaceae bacterium]|nr:hypothetical protein [Planctomycetaceae bacterium]